MLGVLLLAGCSSGATTAPASLPDASGSGAAGCTAAPAPPVDQEGWTSAPVAPTVFPVIVNSSGSLTCGENRLLFTFLDAANAPIGNPDRTASLALYNLGRDGTAPVQSVEGTFVWGIEGERGFYVTKASFPEAGRWGAEFTTQHLDEAPETIRMTFDVATSTPVVRVGDRAPASDTPTAQTADELATISSDPSPDPAFYRVSVKDAIAEHDPFVLVFATPLFCLSAQCGPTLDRVKAVAADYADVTFINVEPYVLEYTDGRLQPVLDQSTDPPTLQSAQTTLDWGLLSEPWVFVVDPAGVVTASFEGVIADSELIAAIEAVR